MKSVIFGLHLLTSFGQYVFLFGVFRSAIFTGRACPMDLLLLLGFILLGHLRLMFVGVDSPAQPPCILGVIPCVIPLKFSMLSRQTSHLRHTALSLVLRLPMLALVIFLSMSASYRYYLSPSRQRELSSTFLLLLRKVVSQALVYASCAIYKTGFN